MELGNDCALQKYFAQIQRYSENIQSLCKDFLEALTQPPVLGLRMVIVCVCVFDVTKYFHSLSAGEEKRITMHFSLNEEHLIFYI
jgi:hypothetical protein